MTIRKTIDLIENASEDGEVRGGMTHKYNRFCLRLSDGKTFNEVNQISGEQVASQTGSAGREIDFLRLLNKWNREGQMSGDMFYCYTAL